MHVRPIDIALFTGDVATIDPALIPPRPLDLIDSAFSVFYRPSITPKRLWFNTWGMEP
jgi:hypothetical protein